MLKIKEQKDRGEMKTEGLLTKSSFSFEEYFDPEYLGIERLKVLNENFLQEGAGFQAMQKELLIFLFVLSGRMEYEDDQRNYLTLLPGDALCLDCSTGVKYHLNNLSATEDVHFYQFWFLPENYSSHPKVDKRQFSYASRWGKWALLGSYNGREGSLPLGQDSAIYTIALEQEQSVVFEALADRLYWVQVIVGSFTIHDKTLEKGDGIYLAHQSVLELFCFNAGELFLIELTP